MSDATSAASTRHGPGDAGFDDLGYARPDTDREARLGVPEVVFGPGKQPGQVVEIVRSLLAANTGPVLVTRVEADPAREVLAAVPDGSYDAQARLLTWRPAAPVGFRLAVVSAGTSDGPVVAEAAAVATVLGLEVDVVTDVGVAGVHRLLAARPRIERADVVVCVAGMEGALPSVVAGLVRAPLVAVPTSVGYGATFDGLAALLAMLSSCAAGVTVVNIDAGFSAAMAAHRIAMAARPGRTHDAARP